MKNKGLTIFLIVLLSMICILLIWLMVFIIRKSTNLSFQGFYNKESDILLIDEKYDVKFNEINLNTETANIYIKEGNEFRIVVYSDNDASVNIIDNKLVVNENKVKNSIFGIIVSKIEIYVPNNYSNDIKITNNLGKIDIGSFNKANIDIDVDCGDIKVASAKNIDIDSELGNIIIDSALSVNIKQAKGNAEIGEVIDVNVINNMGNIVIDKVTNYMNIEEDCGNVHIKDANINKNSYIKNSLGNISIDKLNEIFVNAKNSLGKANIANNYSSDVTLIIENDCGNITVNN